MIYELPLVCDEAGKLHTLWVVAGITKMAAVAHFPWITQLCCFALKQGIRVFDPGSLAIVHVI